MADFETAAENALESLSDSASGGMVEEYEIGPGKRRVKRGAPTSQVDAALKLAGIAARRSGGLFNVAKLQDPR